MVARWPDASPERFTGVAGALLAIHTEGGYSAEDTLASIMSQYQEIIGQLPETKEE